VIGQDPKYADAYYQLGKVQLEKGNTQEAVFNLEAGIRLNPEGDYIHYQLALAYRRQLREEDAEREMKVYQALKDRHRGRNAAQQN
jgi:Tfp pilus assembly protein PilF